MRYVLGTGSNSRLVIREPRYRTIDVPSSYQMATRRLLSRLPPRDDGIDDLLVVYSTSAASSTTTATTVPTGIYERADPGLELWCAVHSTAALYRTKEDRSWAVGTVGDVLKDEGILLSMREGDDVPTPIGIPYLVDDGTQDSDMIFAGGVGVRAATDAERDAMQWRALAEYSSTVHSARWVPASRWFSPLYRRTLGLFRSVGRQRDAGGSRDSHWQALAEAVGAHNVCRTLRAFLCTGAWASPGSSSSRGAISCHFTSTRTLIGWQSSAPRGFIGHVAYRSNFLEGDALREQGETLGISTAWCTRPVGIDEVATMILEPVSPGLVECVNLGKWKISHLSGGELPKGCRYVVEVRVCVLRNSSAVGGSGAAPGGAAAVAAGGTTNQWMPWSPWNQWNKRVSKRGGLLPTVAKFRCTGNMMLRRGIYPSAHGQGGELVRTAALIHGAIAQVRVSVRVRLLRKYATVAPRLVKGVANAQAHAKGGRKLCLSGNRLRVTGWG